MFFLQYINEHGFQMTSNMEDINWQTCYSNARARHTSDQNYSEIPIHNDKQYRSKVPSDKVYGWKNLHSENVEKKEQQPFSSTYLHFNDDSGCHQPTSSSTRPRVLRKPAKQQRNENTGQRCEHSDSVMVELPERIYKKLPGFT